MSRHDRRRGRLLPHVLLPIAAVTALVFSHLPPVAAQAANATIRGTVLDETGAAVPGVTVTAKSPALLVPQVDAVTDAEGQYRLSELPIGEYTVDYELSGFQRVVREDIALSVGFTAELNVRLKVGALAETITVSGASPVVDTTSTTPSVNLSAKFLTEVIPATRKMQDLLTTTPSVQPRAPSDLGGGTSGGGAYSVYGIVGQTTVLIEGVNTRQDSVIDQGTGNGPDFASLEEMQVVTVAGGAEQALPGVYMNMIVKSGGNSFHGRGEFLGLTDKFQSDNTPDSLRAQGITIGEGFKSSAETSGDLGGRILRDRLWFYVAGRYQKTERTALGFSKAPGPDGVFATADDAAATRKGTQTNTSVKGTYQMSPKFRWIAYYGIHTEDYDPYPTATGSARFNPYPSTQTFAWNPHQIKGEVQGQLSNRLLFNAIVGRQRYDGHYAPQPGSELEPRRFDQFTQLNLGPAQYLDRPRQSWGPSASVTYLPQWSLLGKHEFKAGFTGMLQFAGTVRRNAAHGNYTLVYNTGRPIQIQTFNYPLDPRSRLNEGGAFVHDTWRLGSRTTLNLGLRFDRFHSWVPPQTKEQGQFGNAGSYPLVEAGTWRLFAPRTGVAYDLGGDGKTVLKATWGRYNHSPGDAFSDPYNRNTAVTTTYRWTDPNNNGDYDPGEVNLDTNGADFVSITGGANNLLNPDLENPRTYEATVGVDRELMANFSARIGYLYVRSADLFDTINIRRPYDAWNVVFPRQDPGPDGVIGSADDGGIVNVYDYEAAYRGSNFVANQRVNRAGDRDPRLHTIEGVFTRRATGKWGMLSSFSLSKNNRPVPAFGGATVAASPGTITTPNDEYYDRDHTWDWQVKMTGNYQLPYQLALSGTYQIYNGVKGARTHTFVGLPSASSLTLRLEEYGTRSGPARDLLNFRVSRDFRFSGGSRLRTSVDVLNATNVANPWDMTFSSGPAFLQWGTLDSPRILRGTLSLTF